MADVACIGECMIELSEHADGSITRAFGGDTLNTALYLARLGIATDYVTALGDDGWSDEMIRAWQSEGIGTDRVLRFAGRLPGLYVIQTDARGERRFSYWRDRAPARDVFDSAETERLCVSLRSDRWIYLSGISLSLYGAPGRARMFEALQAARNNGARVAFDTNFRPRGWPVLAEARQAYATAFMLADLIFASEEDMAPLFDAGRPRVLLEHKPRAEIVIKCAAADGMHVDVFAATAPATARVTAPSVEHVIDTTAAGDSFAAAYLAARIRGQESVAAAAAGHRLAGRVVQHRGAIIPASAMPR